MDYRVLIIAPIAALVLAANATSLRMPNHWMSSDHPVLATPAPGQMPRGYEIGLEPLPDASGLPSLTVRSIAALSTQAPSLGAVHQVAYGYAGQRVRLSGQVRAEGVAGWAGLYVGIGEFVLPASLVAAKPGVEQRLPKGAAAVSSAWQDVSVVFDVPADAPAIDLGLALVGQGQAWARALRFEVVGAQVPVTTTSIGFDVAQARAYLEQSAKPLEQMVKSGNLPRMPLVNPALD